MPKLTLNSPKCWSPSQGSGWGLPGLGMASHLWHFRAPGLGTGSVVVVVGGGVVTVVVVVVVVVVVGMAPSSVLQPEAAQRQTATRALPPLTLYSAQERLEPGGI